MGGQRGLHDVVISSATVGSVTTEVLADDPTEKREYASFVNDSDETIYLALGVPAVIGQGVRLNASGGAYELEESNLFQGAINAICVSGGKNLAISDGK